MNDESVKQSVEDALLQAYAGRCEACHTSPFTGVLRSAPGREPRRPLRSRGRGPASAARRLRSPDRFGAADRGRGARSSAYCVAPAVNNVYWLTVSAAESAE